MRAKVLHFLVGFAVVLLAENCAFGISFENLALNSTPIRFAIIGDRTSQATPGIYEEIVGEIEELRPDFVITVGDAIQGYTGDTLTLNSQWDEYLSIIKPLTMPIYLTPGNHDITSNAALPTYQHRIGKPYYSFNVRNFHFVVLDVTRWESGEELPSDELTWLAGDLSANKDAAKTLVFYHKPFWYDTIVMGKPDTLHSLFKAYGVDAVFNGHLHTYFSTRIDGILYTALGSSGGIADAVPGGLDYHFTWVTLSDSAIDIAPIKKGSVKPWDIVTAGEEHVADNIIQNGLVFIAKAPVGDDLKISNGIATIEFNNISAQTLNDTIRWSVPRGWSIQPAEENLAIMPKGKKQVSFQVTSSGNLYPVPTVTIGFPFAENKTIPIVKDLKIARFAAANPAGSPPSIDGKLNDKCWKNPEHVLFAPDGSTAKIEATWFYFSYDKDNLYLAAHCQESAMNSLVASVKKRDGSVSGEDCVGFFIQPNPQIDTAYQIYINPLGTILDQKISKGIFGYFEGEKSWNGNYKIKTRSGKDYWDLEVSIPLKQLGIIAAPNQSWGLNFLRKQKRLNTAGDWQVPIDYNPDSFGILKLQ